MSKPDDIPQDVWDAAGYSVTAAPVYTGILHENVARAIMAERERCAKIAWMLGATSTDPFVGNAGHFVADAIRRGTP